MRVHAWSKHAMRGCGISDRPLDFDIASSGVWAQAVRQRHSIVVDPYEAYSESSLFVSFSANDELSRAFGFGLQRLVMGASVPSLSLSR
jgi:hypothetical protein